jgi:hypothetical protein
VQSRRVCMEETTGAPTVSPLIPMRAAFPPAPARLRRRGCPWRAPRRAPRPPRAEGLRWFGCKGADSPRPGSGGHGDRMPGRRLRIPRLPGRGAQARPPRPQRGCGPNDWRSRVMGEGERLSACCRWRPYFLRLFQSSSTSATTRSGKDSSPLTGWERRTP